MLSRSTLRELRGESSRIEQERASLHQRLADLDQQLALLQNVLTLYDTMEDEPEESTSGVKTIRNEMLAILREIGKPLSYRALYEHLIARDVPVPGKEPLKNVAAHLSNDQRFKRMGQGLWGLASWPTSMEGSSAPMLGISTPLAGTNTPSRWQPTLPGPEAAGEEITTDVNPQTDSARGDTTI